jgi:hypothetical protein
LDFGFNTTDLITLSAFDPAGIQIDEPLAFSCSNIPIAFTISVLPRCLLSGNEIEIYCFSDRNILLETIFITTNSGRTDQICFDIPLAIQAIPMIVAKYKIPTKFAHSNRLFFTAYY